MTIDTISGFNKWAAYLTHRVQRIVKTINDHSEEFLWRKARQHTRKQLSGLSDEQLRDIGVSRGDADAEARRSFWD